MAMAEVVISWLLLSFDVLVSVSAAMVVRISGVRSDAGTQGERMIVGPDNKLVIGRGEENQFPALPRLLGCSY